MTTCPVCTAPTRLTWTSCPQCGHALEAALPPFTPAPVETEEPADLPPGATPCMNHPRSEATCACSVCAEAFCSQCVDQAGVGATCKSCLAADGASAFARSGAAPVETPASGLAKEALVLSIIGIFCLGIVLEPMALYKALKARNQIASSPVPMKGAGKATAAIVIASIVLGLWVLGIIARLAGVQ